MIISYLQCNNLTETGNYFVGLEKMFNQIQTRCENIIGVQGA